MSHLQVVVLSLLSIFSGSVSQADGLRVVESATEIRFKDNKSIVTLNIENIISDPQVEISLVIIDPSGYVKSDATQRTDLKIGNNKFTIELPKLKSFTNLAHNRLKYSVTAIASSGKKGLSSSGFISLSEIMPEYFDLIASTIRYNRSGEIIKVNVQSINSNYKTPVAGVKLKACLNFESSGLFTTLPVCVESTTNKNGSSIINLKIPENVSDKEAKLNITGKLGPVERESEDNIHIYNSSGAILVTDKPLYQPGQQLHARALLFDNQKHAKKNVEVNFEIKGYNGDVLHQTDMKTSEFGVASMSWPIPESAKSGMYRINISSNNEDSLSRGFKVSRYNIPTFKVDVNSDRKYYLAGQTPKITVNGNYLFGKPVTKGLVKIVFDSGTDDHYKAIFTGNEQIEGSFDSTGQFIHNFNIDNHFKKLEDLEDARFADLSFKVYVTDQSSGYTEETRFDVRITKHPIHLYLLPEGYGITENFPSRLYITASYADGSPAQCEIKLSE